MTHKSGWSKCTVRLGGRWFHDDGSTLESPLVRGKLSRTWMLTLPDKTELGPFSSFTEGKRVHLEHSPASKLPSKRAVPKSSIKTIIDNATKLRLARKAGAERYRKAYVSENSEYIKEYQRAYQKRRREQAKQ